MIAILADIAYTYAPLIVIAVGIVYTFFASWRWQWPMLPDAGLAILYCARPSLGMLMFVLLIGAVRWTPRMADELSAMCRLDTYDGWTDALIRFLLPAMSSPAMSADQSGAVPVPVLVPSTTGTKAMPPVDRDITKEAWIAAMAGAIDDDGKYLFSASRIHAAVGGHRATVLAMVKAIQEPDTSAQFRSDDGIGPASYPVSKGNAQ